MADPDSTPVEEAPASPPAPAPKPKAKASVSKAKAAPEAKPAAATPPASPSPAPKDEESTRGAAPATPGTSVPEKTSQPTTRKAPAEPPKTVVDVTGLVLGRASSHIAQRLLKGEWIVVVNAEQCVITGSRTSVLETYRAHRARGSKRTGPHFPRYPDRIFRRTVRGMLPHLKTRGKQALDRLEVHIGVPPEYQGRTTQTIENARARPALRPPITLGEVTHNLGAPW